MLAYPVARSICAGMKRPIQTAERGKIIKTSISLPDVLFQHGMQKCEREGFATFSAYLAHLIRLDRARDEEKQIGLAKASARPVVYPTPGSELNEVKDVPPDRRTRKKTGT